MKISKKKKQSKTIFSLSFWNSNNNNQCMVLIFLRYKWILGFTCGGLILLFLDKVTQQPLPNLNNVIVVNNKENNKNNINDNRIKEQKTSQNTVYSRIVLNQNEHFNNTLAFDKTNDIPSITSSSTSTTTSTTTSSSTTKKILYYTSYFGTPDFQFGTGHEPFLDYNCPIHDCIAHTKMDATILNAFHNNNNNNNNKIFGDYDAVLFSPEEFNTVQLKPIQQWRRPHQRFVFVYMESPQSSKSPMILSSSSLSSIIPPFFFNWTMTYRWDSDIPRPYGWFQNKPQQQQQQQETFSYPHPPRHGIARNNNNDDDNDNANENFWNPTYNENDFIQSLSSKSDTFFQLAKRPNKIAWVVSNCHTNSQREEYVRLLQRYIPVDIFGKCHNNLNHNSNQNDNNSFNINFNCNSSYSIWHDNDNCTEQVKTRYKFYLSFENSLCNDYVTEKFFRRMESSVVIVLGQANYSTIAPPHSYINIFDYPTVQDLAKYILELDQNDTKYLSYFWWKDYYNVIHPYYDYNNNVDSSSSSLISPEEGEKEKQRSLLVNENNIENENDHEYPTQSNNNKNHKAPHKQRNNFGPSMCHLCAKLHENDYKNENDNNNHDNSFVSSSTTTTTTKVYNNLITDWWEGMSECGKSMKDLQQIMRRDFFTTIHLPGMGYHANSHHHQHQHSFNNNNSINNKDNSNNNHSKNNKTSTTTSTKRFNHLRSFLPKN